MARKNIKKVIVKGNDSAPVYFFGGVGAAVFYIQQAEGFWAVIWAIIKVFIWPVFFVYDVLKYVT